MISSKKPDPPERRGDVVLHGEHMILVPSPVSLHSPTENEIAIVIHDNNIRQAT